MAKIKGWKGGERKQIIRGKKEGYYWKNSFIDSDVLIESANPPDWNMWELFIRSGGIWKSRHIFADREDARKAAVVWMRSHPRG